MMKLRDRWISAVLTAGLLVALGNGCGKSEPRGAKSSAATSPKTTLSDKTSNGEIKPDHATSPESSGAESSTAPAAGGWGDLTGTFVYAGDAPKLEKLSVTKDTEFCMMMPPVDETVVVNPENGGLKNVVVYLYLKRGADPPPIHESYEAGAADEVALDNEWCRFDDHVVALRTTQKLVVKNSDKIAHNTKIDSVANPGINPILPPGQDIQHEFSKEERLPIPVSCSIHPWMKGYIVVKDSPYFAVSDEDGKFTIKNLPTGEWTFQIWHEKPGYVDDVVTNGEAVEWSKGRVDVAIGPGENDLGEIKLEPSLFQ